MIVTGLHVITPGDAGYLWEAVRKSGSIEKELGIGELQEERKYLEALAESYRNEHIGILSAHASDEME